MYPFSAFRSPVKCCQFAFCVSEVCSVASPHHICMCVPCVSRSQQKLVTVSVLISVFVFSYVCVCAVHTQRPCSQKHSADSRQGGKDLWLRVGTRHHNWCQLCAPRQCEDLWAFLPTFIPSFTPSFLPFPFLSLFSLPLILSNCSFCLFSVHCFVLHLDTLVNEATSLMIF